MYTGTYSFKDSDESPMGEQAFPVCRPESFDGEIQIVQPILGAVGALKIEV
jgi:hypothetical protein